MILIIAKLVVKPGKENELLEIAKPLIEGSNAEDGCIEYILYRDRDKGNIFHFVEKWKDMEAVKIHQAASHYVEAGPRLDVVLESSEATFHEPA